MHNHPRLYVDRAALDRLSGSPSSAVLKAAARDVAERAAHFVTMPPLTYQPEGHNALLARAREVQTRVVTLLVRWFQTGKARFRQAALDYVEEMGVWDYWSWIAMRAGDDAPDAIFDLSYGENCATLAIAYDWLYETLAMEELISLTEIARYWAFDSGLKHARKGGAWWFGKPDSNWNTVCAGGLGMLALAMAEDVPEAQQLLPRVEASIAPYMRYLDETGGAWPEGIGYWNYGMRYAFMYLLSHERATGEPHPLLELAGVRRTLDFPLDFCPMGVPCSFGDVNHWSPLPFHYATAARLGAGEVQQALDAHLATFGITGGSWPNAAEWLVLHPDTGLDAGEEIVAEAGDLHRCDGVRLYEGLDWGVLADASADPYLYMAVRGGTTEVPHGHRDLLSFHCVVGREKLIHNLGPDEYLDSTFSPRRDEIPEITPAYKNTLLINGVGITTHAALESTRIVQVPGAKGIRLEATGAMGEMRDGPAATFCGRLVLLLEECTFLILDHVVLPYPGRIESRMHTLVDVQVGEAGALLQGETEVLRMAYAASAPALLATATTAPTTPSSSPATVLRWCTGDRAHVDVVMATLLAPGAAPAHVTVAQDAGVLRATVAREGWSRTLVVRPDLYPVDQEADTL